MNPLFTLLTCSRAAQPVVAALPRRAAELQAHRSFCLRQAIVRTAAVAQGMDQLYLTPLSLHSNARSFHLVRSQSLLFTLISPSILLSLIPRICVFFLFLTISSLSSFQTCIVLSLLTLFFWFIHYTTGMFYSFCPQPWFPLLSNCRPVASQQLGAAATLLTHFSLQYVSYKIICDYKQWWPHLDIFRDTASWQVWQQESHYALWHYKVIAFS